MFSKILKIYLLVCLSSFALSQCEDVGSSAGFSCDQLLNSFGFTCEDEFGPDNIVDICPVSCDACECEDVGSSAGFSCDQLLNSFGFTCEDSFGPDNVVDICPESCSACDEEEEGITDGCDLPEYTFYLTDSGEVLYNSPEDIYGFQFDIDGASGSGSGGDAAGAGFQISGSTTILAFSFSGASISAGCGTLVELDLEGEATGLSGIVVSGPGGSSISFTYYGDDSDPDAGCTDESACNYDEDALTDDGSCDYAEENFDCDGNCLVEEDCAGECGGDAEIGCDGICDSGLTNDECGVCDGPGAIYECGCEELPGSISGGCDLPDYTFYLGDNGEVFYNSPEDIYGFQFTIDGTSGSGSGGDAAAAGFQISGSTTILAFSFSGAFIPAGCGTLLELDLNGEAAGLSGLVVSGPGGANIDFSYYSNLDGEVCDCDGNTLDECGICDGPGAIYECGCEGLPTEDVSSGCDLPDYTFYLGDNGEVFYNSPEDIYGFQFTIDGTSGSGSGGDAAAAGFSISGSTTILAFSFSGASISAGCGTLVELDLNGEATGLSGLVVSGAGGANIDFSYYSGSDGEICDCDGNVLDECGVCNGDGIADGACDCSGTPYSYLSDTYLYFSNSSEDCNDISQFEYDINNPEYVWTFNEDGTIDDNQNSPLSYFICGGNIFVSESQTTELTILENGWLAGCANGVSPIVLILDIPGCTDELAVNYNEEATSDDGTCDYETAIDYELDLHFGANLVSFYALPDDTSLANMLSSLDGVVTGIIGEGVAASPNPVLGWVGSLTSIDPLSGYWIKVDQAALLSVEDANLTDPSALYNLRFGANLISFPSLNPVPIGDAIPDDVEGNFLGIIGEGVAASPNPVLGWVGSLSNFEGGKGYWAKVDQGISFSFDTSSSDARLISDSTFDVPYIQSTEQAFYFIEDIDVSGYGELEFGNLIKAYNNGVLVGQREWNGPYTDIPAMGNDLSLETAGYCEVGDNIEFTITLNDGVEYSLNGMVPGWASNEIYSISSLQIDAVELVPSQIMIVGAYPNPFNPSTAISYQINQEADVNISVFNLNGQLVAELFNGSQDIGIYQIDFNGDGLSSGMYIVKVSNQSEIHTQKILLMK